MSDTMAHEDLRTTAAEVQRLVGARLTAYLVNLDSVGDLPNGLGKDHGAGTRLHAVVRLADIFRRVNAICLFRAWLREVDNDLGKDTCPADLIRECAEPALSTRLTSCADRYLLTV